MTKEMLAKYLKKNPITLKHKGYTIDFFHYEIAGNAIYICAKARIVDKTPRWFYEVLKEILRDEKK